MTPESSGHRRSRRTVLAGLGGVGAGLFGLRGASGASSERASEHEERRSEPPSLADRFVEPSTNEATGSNPVVIRDTTTANRLDKLYDGLGGRFGPDTFDPRWAASWEQSDDYRVVEYTLRDGLRWGGNYGQLTAEDYVYTLTELVVQEEGRRWFPFPDRKEYLLGPAEERIRYEKTGPLSFRAELPVAKPQWLHEDPLLDLIALPRSLLERYVPNQDADGIRDDADATDGTLAEGNLGPYTFEEWERGTRWVYRRNDDYYMQDHADEAPFAGDPYYDFRNAPYFREYQVRVFSEQAAAQNALKVGDVDVASFQPREVEDVRSTTGVDVWEDRYQNGVYWLNLNHRINGWAPIRESREVRRALTNLYDRETVVEQVYEGNVEPTGTFHPRWGPYYPDEDDLYLGSGTVDRAKSLLQSGTSSDYGYDSEGVFRGPDGSQVRLRAVRTTGTPAIELAAEYVGTRLEEAGIGLDISAESWSTLLGNYARNDPANVDGVDEPDWSVGAYNGGPWNQSASAKEWDLMFGLGFEANPQAPWGTLSTTMPEKATFNLWGYHQDELDIRQQLEEAATASDRAVTTSKMEELLGFLSRDVAMVWTNSETGFEGYRDHIGGFPGEERSWGASADSPFQDPDPARLLRITDETVSTETPTMDRPDTTTRATTTETATTRATTAETTSDPAPSTSPPTTAQPQTTAPPSEPTEGGGDDTTSPTEEAEGTVEFGDESDAPVPGFGAVAALGGAAGLAEYARRRGDEGDGEE